MKLCEICNKPLEKCACCDECGLIYGFNQREKYCHVCLPEKTYKTIMPIPKYREHNEK